MIDAIQEWVDANVDGSQLDRVRLSIGDHESGEEQYFAILSPLAARLLANQLRLAADEAEYAEDAGGA